MSYQRVTVFGCAELKTLTKVTPDQVKKRPLVIILGWLGATRKALEKFHPFYSQRNCDILTIQPTASQFLWPPKASHFTLELLEYLNKNHSNRPIMIHGFSIGCYVYSMMLIHLARSSQYANIRGQIRGQVYDSLTIGGLKQMAIGVSKSVHSNAMVRALIQQTLMAYFWLTRSVTVRNYDIGIDMFKNSPVKAPGQFFYSLCDPLCDPQAMKLAMEELERNGVEVSAKSWPDSGHTMLFRDHPSEYTEILNHFLDGLNLGSRNVDSKL